MTNLGLLDAWNLWLDGQSTIGHTLYGIPIIWVGRAGKVLAFISAFTILIDILGPERINDYGRWLQVEKFPVDTTTAQVLIWVAVVVNIALSFLVLRIMHLSEFTGLAAVLVTLFAVGGPIASLFLGPRVLGWLLSKPGFATAVRTLSLVGLIIGFHFDLLAS